MLSNNVSKGYVLQLVKDQGTVVRGGQAVAVIGSLSLTAGEMQALADAFVIKIDGFAVKNADKPRKLWEFDGFPVEREFSFNTEESAAFHRVLKLLCIEGDLEDLSIYAKRVNDVELPDLLAKVMAFLEAGFDFAKSVYAWQMIESYQEDQRVERLKRKNAQERRILEFLGKEAIPLPRPTDSAIRGILSERFKINEKWLDAHVPAPIQGEDGPYLRYAYENEIISALLELEEGEASLTPLELLDETLEARLQGFSEHWYLLAWAMVGRHVNVTLRGIEFVSPPRPAMAA